MKNMLARITDGISKVILPGSRDIWLKLQLYLAIVPAFMCTKKNIFQKFNKPKLSKYKYYEKIAIYLNIPPDDVQKALGEKSGHTQNEKIAFANKYDRGKRIITTINRKAEIKGNWIESWKELKYLAIAQEFSGFKRIDFIWNTVLPLIEILGPVGELKVLDYGCGTSVFSRLLLERYPCADLTLCDVNGYHLYQ